MADNLKGIPFSSDDEGISFPDRAKAAVLGATELHENPLTLDEIYVVSFTYILGNYKAVLSTSRPDGRYFEVTYNSTKSETYVDLYVRVDQVIIHHIQKQETHA